MKQSLVALLVIFLVSVPCGAQEEKPIGQKEPVVLAIISPKEQEQVVREEPFVTIAKRGITQKQLAEAIAKLTLPTKEPAAFWSRIANDSRYPVFHRRRAVERLFKRHAYAGMSLLKLSKLLEHPKWLHERDLSMVAMVLGFLPVDGNLVDGTVFIINVLPDKNPAFAGIYIRIPRPQSVLEDEHALENFKKLMLGTFDSKRPPELGNVKIEEIGYYVTVSE